MIEKTWASVAPVALTAAGNVRGLVTVTSTEGFRVKMAVTIQNGANALLLEIKRVVSPTQMFLGERGDIKFRSDLTAFPAGSIVFSNEQPRVSIPLQEIERAVYEEEPVVALRTIGVDIFGRPYTTQNPMPVQLTDGSINIGTVNAELETQLSHLDNWPDVGDVHDSVRIGSGVSGEYLKVYPAGDIDVRSIGRTPEEKLKGDLLCSSDLDRDMTWSEIDGVRRVTQIVFTSANLDAAVGNIITLTRSFTYQSSDPFDLIEIKDALTVV